MDHLTLFNLRQPPLIDDDEQQPETYTTILQSETQSKVHDVYYSRLLHWRERAFRLFRPHHVGFLTKILTRLPPSYQFLDASQPWLTYWTVHSLRLLDYELPRQLKDQLISMIASTQHPDGGFAGGPKQMAHLAPTYGAVNCLASLNDAAALELIDRDRLVQWLRRIRQPNGSFQMHINGETDVRGTYCAIAVAKLLRLGGDFDSLFDQTAEWLSQCQTYEGGYGAEPGIEAHGGYTFCAVASLCLLNRSDLIDLPRLLRWATQRQMACEGGFQGRTNKLVDSCYSFWLGGLFPIIEHLSRQSCDPAVDPSDTLFNSTALQEYILLCCQKVPLKLIKQADDSDHQLDSPSITSNDEDFVEEKARKSHKDLGGGLVDKPGKSADAYHTCYSLSGLSLAQHAPRNASSDSQLGSPNPCPVTFNFIDNDNESDHRYNPQLADIDPLHNVVQDSLAFTLAYFDAVNNRLSQAAELAERARLDCKARAALLASTSPKIKHRPVIVDVDNGTSSSPSPTTDVNSDDLINKNAIRSSFCH